MAKLRFSGPFLYRLRSFAALNRIALKTYARHTFGRRMAPDWDAHFETGILFWRHQFTSAMNHPQITKGRSLFNSLQTETDDIYDVTMEPCPHGKGKWYHPATRRSQATLLYLHGGGYAFGGAVSERFAAMLAHHTGATLYAPDYRLTPEHPHPAQAEDALTAWTLLSEKVPPQKIIVIGDSAGGHMALMLLQTLKANGLAQPALCVGLCPWTDIGHRGASLHDNNQYDLVQGWMALQFGTWLDPEGTYGRETLSPIFQDFSGLAPIYLQVGGREILRDMIIEFAQVQKIKGADITLDVWPDMPHNFQAYDSLRASSALALTQLAKAIQAKDKPEPASSSVTDLTKP